MFVSQSNITLVDVNRCVLRAFLSSYFLTTWHFSDYRVYFAIPVDPAIHFLDYRICITCWLGYSFGLEYTMYQPSHRLCLFCNRSVERIRRHTLARDLQNQHQHTVQNIIRALTREVSTYILFSSVIIQNKPSTSSLK